MSSTAPTRCTSATGIWPVWRRVSRLPERRRQQPGLFAAGVASSPRNGYPRPPLGGPAGRRRGGRGENRHETVHRLPGHRNPYLFSHPHRLGKLSRNHAVPWRWHPVGRSVRWPVTPVAGPGPGRWHGSGRIPRRLRRAGRPHRAPGLRRFSRRNPRRFGRRRRGRHGFVKPPRRDGRRRL